MPGLQDKSNIIHKYIDIFDELMLFLWKATMARTNVRLNFKHLRYFWVVAKCGSIARAGEQLHVTPQSIRG